MNKLINIYTDKLINVHKKHVQKNVHKKIKSNN